MPFNNYFLQTVPVSGMILSAQFWPAFREEKLELPKDMQEALEKYTGSFEALKGNRTLNWKPHLGMCFSVFFFTFVNSKKPTNGFPDGQCLCVTSAKS